jgi:PadR family transcriptional regulator PadR
MRPEAIGQFELLVLLAILRIGDGAYGVSIAQTLDEASGQETAVASVYAALQRLEAKGLVRTRLGDPTPERGGRAKRFAEITAAGRRQARQSQRTLQRLWHRTELEGRVT